MKKLKKWWKNRPYWQKGGIVILILIFIFITTNNIYIYTKVPTIPKEDISLGDYCEEDSDCIEVKSGCCGCSAGGSNEAVNKNNYKESDCGNVGCIMVISDHWTCSPFVKAKCVKNQCILTGFFKVKG